MIEKLVTESTEAERRQRLNQGVVANLVQSETSKWKSMNWKYTHCNDIDHVHAEIVAGDGYKKQSGP